MPVQASTNTPAGRVTAVLQAGMNAPATCLLDGSGNILGQVVTGDSMSGTFLPGFVPLVFNGTTYDRLKGSNGAFNTLTQSAFTVYQESAVVNGARLTTGNITGGSIPNNASIFLVSVNVSVFAGGTNVIYSLQVQDTNGNWAMVGSSATITATGVYAFSVGPGMTNGNLLPAGNGNWRVSWVVTGTFTNLTSQIGVTGR